jgi:hypothetical protein
MDNYEPLLKTLRNLCTIGLSAYVRRLSAIPLKKSCSPGRRILEEGRWPVVFRARGMGSVPGNRREGRLNNGSMKRVLVGCESGCMRVGA